MRYEYNEEDYNISNTVNPVVDIIPALLSFLKIIDKIIFVLTQGRKLASTSLLVCNILRKQLANVSPQWDALFFNVYLLLFFQNAMNVKQK